MIHVLKSIPINSNRFAIFGDGLPFPLHIELFNHDSYMNVPFDEDGFAFCNSVIAHEALRIAESSIETIMLLKELDSDIIRAIEISPNTQVNRHLFIKQLKEWLMKEGSWCEKITLVRGDKCLLEIFRSGYNFDKLKLHLDGLVHEVSRNVDYAYGVPDVGQLFCDIASVDHLPNEEWIKKRYVFPDESLHDWSMVPHLIDIGSHFIDDASPLKVYNSETLSKLREKIDSMIKRKEDSMIADKEGVSIYGVPLNNFGCKPGVVHVITDELEGDYIRNSWLVSINEHKSFQVDIRHRFYFSDSKLMLNHRCYLALLNALMHLRGTDEGKAVVATMNAIHPQFAVSNTSIVDGLIVERIDPSRYDELLVEYSTTDMPSVPVFIIKPSPKLVEDIKSGGLAKAFITFASDMKEPVQPPPHLVYTQGIYETPNFTMIYGNESDFKEIRKAIVAIGKDIEMKNNVSNAQVSAEGLKTATGSVTEPIIPKTGIVVTTKDGGDGSKMWHVLFMGYEFNLYVSKRVYSKNCEGFSYRDVYNALNSVKDTNQLWKLNHEYGVVCIVINPFGTMITHGDQLPWLVFDEFRKVFIEHLDSHVPIRPRVIGRGMDHLPMEWSSYEYRAALFHAKEYFDKHGLEFNVTDKLHDSIIRMFLGTHGCSERLKEMEDDVLSDIITILKTESHNGILFVPVGVTESHVSLLEEAIMSNKSYDKSHPVRVIKYCADDVRMTHNNNHIVKVPMTPCGAVDAWAYVRDGDFIKLKDGKMYTHCLSNKGFSKSHLSEATGCGDSADLTGILVKEWSGVNREQEYVASISIITKDDGSFDYKVLNKTKCRVTIVSSDQKGLECYLNTLGSQRYDGGLAGNYFHDGWHYYDWEGKFLEEGSDKFIDENGESVYILTKSQFVKDLIKVQGAGLCQGGNITLSL